MKKLTPQEKIEAIRAELPEIADDVEFWDAELERLIEQEAKPFEERIKQIVESSISVHKQLTTIQELIDKINKKALPNIYGPSFLQLKQTQKALSVVCEGIDINIVTLYAEHLEDETLLDTSVRLRNRYLDRVKNYEENSD